jgi:hypothetical protein
VEEVKEKRKDSAPLETRGGEAQRFAERKRIGEDEPKPQVQNRYLGHPARKRKIRITQRAQRRVKEAKLENGNSKSERSGKTRR